MPRISLSKIKVGQEVLQAQYYKNKVSYVNEWTLDTYPIEIERFCKSKNITVQSVMYVGKDKEGYMFRKIKEVHYKGEWL